jgi:glycosyltransferase involved in cell wall biosynthesis
MRVVVVAPEWASEQFGISEFNRGLCAGLVDEGHDVICLIEGSIDTDRLTGETINVVDEQNYRRWRRSAAEVGVDLRLVLMVSSFTAPGTIDLPDPIDLVIGHDRLTGRIACSLAARHPGSRAVTIFHTAPDPVPWEYGISSPRKWLLRTPEVAQRIADAVELARRSDGIVALGPHLAGQLRDLFGSHDLDREVHVAWGGIQLGQGWASYEPPFGHQVIGLSAPNAYNLDPLAPAIAAAGQVCETRPGLRLRVNLAPRSSADRLHEIPAPYSRSEEAAVRLSELGAPPGTGAAEWTGLGADLTGLDILLIPYRSDGIGPVAHDWAWIDGDDTALDTADRQRPLAVDADHVVGVGPGLQRSTQQILDGRDIDREVGLLQPGLSPDRLHDLPERSAEADRRVLIVGRWDPGVKGHDIAGRAVALAEHEPHLIIRGIEAGDEAHAQRSIADTGLALDRVELRLYTTDAREIVADYADAAVVIMPSRAEGYGLIAGEAVAYGQPIPISDRSGYADHLLATDPDLAERFVVPVTGRAGDDARAWADATDRTLAEPDGARRDAVDL